MRYLMLKHYRGGPPPHHAFAPMDRWTPEEVDAHVSYMRAFAEKLKGTGEYVGEQALRPDGAFVRSGGAGREPVVDGPFAETKDLVAGWMVVDVESHERAVELAAELSEAPGPGGEPILEWLELRPAYAPQPEAQP